MLIRRINGTIIGDFEEVKLRGANFEGADLRGADLRGANLQGIKGIAKWRRPELKELLDWPDPITAYRLVDTEGCGPYAGVIKYEIIKEIRVNKANTDVQVLYEAGINVATKSWVLRKWEPEYRILAVEFNAADIAALPIGTDGQFRLHRCKVVKEINIEELKNIKE